MFKFLPALSFLPKRRKKGYQHTIKAEFIRMSEMASKLADEFDSKILATKEALVHLVGEYAIAMLELKSSYQIHDELSGSIDHALKSGNDDLARLKLIERVNVEKRIELFTDTIELLIPRIKKIYSKKIELSSAQSEAIHRSQVLEARARSSEAIGRAQDIIGTDDKFDIDLGIASLNNSVDKIDAYSAAIEEVHGNDDRFDSKLRTTDKFDEMLKNRRAELGIN